MRTSLLRIASLLLLAGLATGLSAQSAPRAGLPDRYVDEGGGVVRLEKDSAGRGFVDYILRFDSRGRKIEEEIDTNGDGRMDTFYYYTNGVLSRVEVDTRYNGKIDLKVWLREGIYVERYERSTRDDGVFDVVKVFGPKEGPPAPSAPSGAAIDPAGRSAPR